MSKQQILDRLTALASEKKTVRAGFFAHQIGGSLKDIQELQKEGRIEVGEYSNLVRLPQPPDESKEVDTYRFLSNLSKKGTSKSPKNQVKKAKEQPK